MSQTKTITKFKLLISLVKEKLKKEGQFKTTGELQNTDFAKAGEDEIGLALRLVVPVLLANEQELRSLLGDKSVDYFIQTLKDDSEKFYTLDVDKRTLKKYFNLAENQDDDFVLRRIFNATEVLDKLSLYVSYVGWKGFQKEKPTTVLEFLKENNPNIANKSKTTNTEKIEDPIEIDSQDGQKEQTEKVVEEITRKSIRRKRRKYQITFLILAITLVSVVLNFAEKVSELTNIENWQLFQKDIEKFPDDVNGILVLAFDGDENGNIQRYLVGTLNDMIDDSLQIVVRSTEQIIDEGRTDYHNRAREIGKGHNAQVVIGGILSKINDEEYINPRITIINDQILHHYIESNQFNSNFHAESIKLKEELVSKPLILTQLIIGLRYFLNDDKENAVNYFESFLEKWKTNEIPIKGIYSLIGFSYHFLFIQDRFNTLYYKKALHYYEKAFRENPESSDLHYKVGALYLGNKEYELAIANFNKAISLDSTNSRAFNGRGIANIAQGNLVQSKNDFLKAYNLDSLNADYILNYVVALHNSGLENLEIRNLEKIVLLHSDVDRAWYMLANSYYKINQINKSISCLNNAIEISPSNSDYWYSLTYIYNEQNKREDAFKCCLKSIELDSTKSKSWELLGLLFKNSNQLEKSKKCYLNSVKYGTDFISSWRSLGFIYYTLKDYDSAVYYYNQLIRLDIVSFSDWQNLGSAYLQNNNYIGAIGCWEKALSIDSTSVDLWFNIGKAFFDHNELEDARCCFETAVSIDSNNSNVLYALGILYNTLGESQYAINCFEKSVNIDPYKYNGWVYCGKCYFDIGKFDKAINCFENGIKIDSTDKNVWHVLGNAYFRQKQFNNAIICQMKAIELDPMYFGSYIQVGKTYAWIGTVDSAIHYYQKANNIKEFNESDWNFLGMLHLDRKDYKIASYCFENALKLNPRESKYFYNLALAIRNEKGPNEKSKRLLISAVELEPNLWEAWNLLGKICSAEKNYREAIEAFKKATLIVPDNYASYSNLGSAYWNLSIFDSSFYYFNKCAKLNPNDTETMYNIGLLYYIQEEYYLAIEFLNKAILRDIDHIKSMEVLANCYTKLGKEDKAKMYTQRVQKLRRENPKE